MPYDYLLLSDDDKAQILAQFILSNERDLYCHQLNKQRFEAMLQLDLPPALRDRVTAMLADTEVRIKEVEAILQTTVPQVEKPALLQEAANTARAKMQL